MSENSTVGAFAAEVVWAVAVIAVAGIALKGGSLAVRSIKNFRKA